MSKHTPGPWHWSSDSLTHRQFDIYAPNCSPQQHICTVNNLSIEKLWARDAEIALANARLIAAAPDMVDLLLAALPYVDEGEQFNKSTHRNLSKQIRALLEKIDA